MLDREMNALEMLFSLFSRHYHPKFPARILFVLMAEFQRMID